MTDGANRGQRNAPVRVGSLGRETSWKGRHRPRVWIDLAGFAATGCIADNISACAVFKFECLAGGAACGAAASSGKTLLNGQPRRRYDAATA